MNVFFFFPCPICHIAQTSFILKKNPQTLYLLVSFHLLPYFSLPSIQTSAEFYALKFSISVAPTSSLTHQPLASIPACWNCPTTVTSNFCGQIYGERFYLFFYLFLFSWTTQLPLTCWHLPCSETFFCWFLRHHSLLILLLPLWSFFNPLFRLHFHRPVPSTLIYITVYYHLGFYVFGSASGLCSFQPPWWLPQGFRMSRGSSE